MAQDKASVEERIPSELLISPHVADKLVHLVAGEWRPDTSQLEQLTTHVVACSACRRVLHLVLSQEEENQPPSDETLHTLYMHVVSLERTLDAQNDEQMAAYAETIHAKGKKIADKQFPVLAEHIPCCPRCKATLDQLLTFLKEDKKDDC